MTSLDIIVIMLLGLNAFLGFRRGFVQELLSLGALVAAIVAVRFGHAPVTEIVASYVANPMTAAIIAFALVFGVVFALGKFISSRIGTASRNSLLGPFDRALGVGFGLIKGLLIAGVLFLIGMLAFNTIYGRDDEQPEWLTDSRTYPLLHAGSVAVTDLVEAQRDLEAE